MDKTSGLGYAADLYGVFVDDVLVGLGVSGLVVDVPSKGDEQRVDKLAADLGFVISACVIIVAVSGEPLSQRQYGPLVPWGLRGLFHSGIY